LVSFFFDFFFFNLGSTGIAQPPELPEDTYTTVVDEVIEG
jgi:hypothetical protein